MNDTTQDQRRSDTPSHGIVQVDGKAATSLGWTRRANGEGRSVYDINLRMGQKSAGTLKGLTLDQLDEAIGEKNTDSIHRNAEVRGTVSGEKLAYHVGKTVEKPVEQTAAEQSPGDLKDTPEAALLAKRMGISVDELQRRLANEASDVERKEAKNTNAVARDRNAVPAGPEQGEADDRKAVQLDAIRKTSQSEVDAKFHHVKDSYYFKDNSKRVAFEDRGHKLVTPETDARVAASMAQIAEAKGWNSIKVTGTREFQREAWLEASARGIEVQGYKPDKADRDMLEIRKQQRMRNAIEQGTPDKERGGAGPGDRDRDNAGKPTGNTRGQTQPDKGKDGQGVKPRNEPTERQIEDLRKRKQSAEDYNLHRPEAEPGKAIPKTRIVAAVADQLARDKIKNPETRARVMSSVGKQLDRMSTTDKVPTLKTYDRHAPAKAREIDKVKPAVERNTERTR